MDLVTPGIGMIFWTTVFFLILLFILGKFAWPAILSAVHTRNDSIRKALHAADKAREEMAKLRSDNEKILAEARAEQDAIMKEAKDIRDRIISEARESAGKESDRLIKNAREAIQNEKVSAIGEMKQQMAILSVKIAEEVLKQKLKGDGEQKKLVEKLLDDMDLN